MEIKIDTDKDSKQDIRRVIRLLESFVNEESFSGSYDSTRSNADFGNSVQKSDSVGSSSGDSYESPEEGLFSIFDSSDTVSSSKSSSVSNHSEDLDKAVDKEKEDDKINFDVIPY